MNFDSFSGMASYPQVCSISPIACDRDVQKFWFGFLITDRDLHVSGKFAANPTFFNNLNNYLKVKNEKLQHLTHNHLKYRKLITLYVLKYFLLFISVILYIGILHVSGRTLQSNTRKIICYLGNVEPPPSSWLRLKIY